MIAAQPAMKAVRNRVLARCVADARLGADPSTRRSDVGALRRGVGLAGCCVCCCATAVAASVASRSGDNGTRVTLTLGEDAAPGQIDDVQPNEEFEEGLAGEPRAPQDKPYKPTESQTTSGVSSPQRRRRGSLHALPQHADQSARRKRGPGPTAANDGNVILATGNTWARLPTHPSATGPEVASESAAATSSSGQREGQDVGQPRVVALGDHGITDSPASPVLGGDPLHGGVVGLADQQRLVSTIGLSGCPTRRSVDPDQLAVAVQDVRSGVDRFRPRGRPACGKIEVTPVRIGVGRAVIAAEMLRWPDPHAGDVGDGVVGPGLPAADPDPQVRAHGGSGGHGRARYDTCSTWASLASGSPSVAPRRAAGTARIHRRRPHQGVPSRLDRTAIDGAVILSTCNRVEVYGDVANYHAGFLALKRLLARRATSRPRNWATPRTPTGSSDAADHLFAVASGARLDGARRDADPRAGARGAATRADGKARRGAGLTGVFHAASGPVGAVRAGDLARRGARCVRRAGRRPRRRGARRPRGSRRRRRRRRPDGRARREAPAPAGRRPDPHPEPVARARARAGRAHERRARRPRRSSPTALVHRRPRRVARPARPATW